MSTTEPAVPPGRGTPRRPAGGPATVVTPAVLRGWPLPPPGEDKHARGQLLVVGGDESTPGAVRLAGEAALRAGAGKLQIATAAGHAPTLAVAVPEAAVHGLEVAAAGRLDPSAVGEVVALADRVDVLLLGSGFSDVAASVRLLEALLPRVTASTVLDALASAYLTEHPRGLLHLDSRAVLCVNPTELARTAHREDREVQADPLGTAREVAARSGVVVLCGGSEKHVADPDGRGWVVQGGGPGLGVSGSGDVQAGIVAGLLARGAEPAQAAVWGAQLHARAGERLAHEVGTVGYLAREIPAQVPAALAEIG
ncbi:NAD(P)H-hydrate dehydratase [Nocardioides ferulae]|uniref:NAD(P)H-hydrate dehydratase n=1 Tax=Nocardioides ferulae TaxID=2340821 RepID=UPI000EAB4DFD|nr:NAD(P)H-hydrate dehydratase [Nocardioides ferulae]